MAELAQAPRSPSPAVMSAIAQAIRSVRFGTIRIAIHDGRVVQIEKAEKIRMESADLNRGGASSLPVSADQTPGGSHEGGSREGR